MSHDVVRLAAPDAHDVDLIGGKAAALAALASAGFPVQPAIGVTISAFRRATDRHRTTIDRILARWDCREIEPAHEAAARIAALLEPLTVPPAVMEEVRAAVQTEIGTEALVAVRSSARQFSPAGVRSFARTPSTRGSDEEPGATMRWPSWCAWSMRNGALPPLAPAQRSLSRSL